LDTFSPVTSSRCKLAVSWANEALASAMVGEQLVVYFQKRMWYCKNY
jgi:hypothetical protein